MTTLKCNICGGDLIRDYSAGLCRCGHCGNSRPLAEAEEGYKDFAHIIEKINKADSLTEGPDVGLKQAEEAVLLYKSAAAACTSQRYSDMSAEIRDLCKVRLEKAEKLKKYAQAKNYFDKKAFKKALNGFEQLKEYRDSDILAAACRDKLAEAQKKRIPYAAAVGPILPAILFFILIENTDMSLAACVLIFAALAAVLGYAVYLHGVFSAIIEVLSFVMLVPLLIFTVLVYLFHLSTGLSAGLSIGIPLALAIVIIVFTERQ